MRLRLLTAPACSLAVAGCLLDDPYYVRNDEKDLDAKGPRVTADDDISEPNESWLAEEEPESRPSQDAGATGKPMVMMVPIVPPKGPDADASLATSREDDDTTEPETSPNPEPSTNPAGSEDAGALCGNGRKEPGESCDGDDIAVTDCTSLTFQAFSSGTVRCTDTCELDTSDCVPVPACGNGILNVSEECDGDDVGEQSCAEQGFSGGTLGCDDECQLDVSDCVEGPACDESLGDSLGEVHYGDTGQEDDTRQLYTCSFGGRGGGDVTLSWTAPATGCFVIATSGDENLDTIAAVYTECSLGDEIACDDDSGVGSYALVEFDAVEATTYAIVVDAYSAADEGPVHVNIQPCPPPEWKCPTGSYGQGDGCDCGCGALDPDCEDDTSDSCNSCNAMGSCARLRTCNAIATNQNFTCN